jgi:hypothetical protein
MGLGTDSSGQWILTRYTCASCRQFVVYLENGQGQNVPEGGVGARLQVTSKRMMVWPKGISRVPLPLVVTPEIAADYKEACTVLADSANASAALSRRCLQAILKDHLGAKTKDLFDQIDEVIAPGKLPTHIAEGLHAVRNIGNFAAHPMKSTTTGAIVDVEPGEAEWNLDVIEMLFDFCFVQPALAAKRKADLNEKLKAIGKPLIP